MPEAYSSSKAVESPPLLGTIHGRVRRGSRLLAAIGEALDDDRGCEVYPDGVVWPRSGRRETTYTEKEVRRSAERTQQFRGREGQPGQGAAIRPAGTPERPAGATAPAWSAAPGAGTPLLRQVANEPPAERLGFEEVLRAYRAFQVRSTSTGLWATGVVKPVQDLLASATLALFVPHPGSGTVRAWAWWREGVWVGPRHTNYADGSICSYEPSDKTWQWANGFVPLIDLHVVWLARHLYLAEYGRWPGRQVLHSPFERLTEHRPGEFCGCGSDKLYQVCCYPADMQLGLARATLARGARLATHVRRPILPSS